MIFKRLTVKADKVKVLVRSSDPISGRLPSRFPPNAWRYDTGSRAGCWGLKDLALTASVDKHILVQQGLLASLLHQV